MLKNNNLYTLFKTNKVDNYIYSPYFGINELCINDYTENNHYQAIIFFKLLDLYNIEYVVFAGSSVGMVRNKRMMPWTDDYDIIILDKHKHYFFSVVMDVIVSYGYNFWGCGTEIRGDEIGVTFVSGLNNKYIDIETSLRIDIFWSKINKKNKSIILYAKIYSI